MIKKFKIPKPVGDRILVEVEVEKDKKIVSDIIAVPEAYENSWLASTKIGKVIDIGPDAFVRLHASEPYCAIGDYISFVSNAGGDLYKNVDGASYRLIKPGDIECIVGVENRDE